MVFASTAIRVVLPPEAILRLLQKSTQASRREIRFRSPSLEEGKPLFQVLASKESDSLSFLKED